MCSVATEAALALTHQYLHIYERRADPPLPADGLQQRVEHSQTTQDAQSSLHNNNSRR